MAMCVNLPSILSPISTETCQNREKMVTGFGFSKTSQSKRVLRFRKFKSLIAAGSLNHIPKQFREENLKEGVMENYKNVPEQFYGLSPSQMDMFATKDSPIFRQSANIKEESLSSAWSYSDSCGRWNMSSMKDGGQSTNCSLNVPHMNHREYGRTSARSYSNGRRPKRHAPPDLPSSLLDARIVYLGMPMFDKLQELIVAELLYLYAVDRTQPIYLYINSSGSKNQHNQIVADDTNAYGIADLLAYFDAGVYTVNIGVAYGQAAMLLSLGTKGYRFLMPHSATKLYLPSMHRINGTTGDIYLQAKELKSNINSFLELLSKGTGKPAEVLRHDLRKTKCFDAEDAIDYGIADRVIKHGDILHEDYGTYSIYRLSEGIIPFGYPSPSQPTKF